MGDIVQFKAKTPVAKTGDDDGTTTVIRIQIHINMEPEEVYKECEKSTKREIKALGFWTGVIAALTLLFSGVL